MSEPKLYLRGWLERRAAKLELAAALALAEGALELQRLHEEAALKLADELTRRTEKLAEIRALTADALQRLGAARDAYEAAHVEADEAALAAWATSDDPTASDLESAALERCA